VDRGGGGSERPAAYQLFHRQYGGETYAAAEAGGGLAVAYIGLQLLAALLHYNQSLLFNRAAVGVVQQLRSDVMDAALHQPLSEFDTQPVGQLISG
jgi:ABC-type multidrug transport system fused ATPase/permease subunit